MPLDLGFIEQYFQESVRVKEAFAAEFLPGVLEVAGVLTERLRSGGKALFFGNGGSAADAQHIAAELVNRFVTQRRGLPAIALNTDTSILTSIANDFDYTYVFARQIEALGRPGDIAFGLSTSGNSPNVVRALETARQAGLLTVALTGGTGGKVQTLADYCLCVPSRETAHIQEVHITICHALCLYVDRAFEAAP